MFRRKNSRAAAHAANAPPASSAASTAAVQAFLASRASSSNLSSAAAAAALRSHTASPTNPASIQTKRMQRRLSNSSNGSAAAKPVLQRQGSNGSMTERTFRDSSPLRSNSPLIDHPPIPPIPKNLPKRPAGGLGRPASTEPTRRVTSPTPNNGDGRGVSLDRGKVKPKNEVVPPMPKPKLSKIDTLAAAESPAKRTSINFSRPMSPTLSPPTSPVPPANGRAKKPDAKQIDPYDAEAAEYAVKNAATTPVPKKKKRVLKDAVEGNQLAAGHTSAKPSGTAVDDIENTEKPDRKLTTNDKTKSESSPSVRPTNTLSKQPSVVQEDIEGEELAEKRTEAPSTRQVTSSAPVATPQAKTTKAAVITPATANQVLTPPPSGDPVPRHASPSPARNARFAVQTASDLSVGVRHQPPPRATSPAKSAMKHSPSPRGASPALLNNDISDNVSVTSEEGRRKKKSAKVSFEDSPVIVGEAADIDPSKSPFILSPQNKDQRSRFHLRDNTDDLDADETITPIPTLPSFGSVRGRRDRSPDEEHKTLYGNEQARKNLADMTSSSDHALAGIITADAATKYSSSDPLPPEVRSVEGSGYHSDSDSADEDDLPSKKVRDHGHVKASSTTEQTSNDGVPHLKEDVPMIAILPATPGHEMDNQDGDGWLSSKHTTTESNAIEPITADDIGAAEPRRESIVEPEPESAQREHDPDSPTVGTIAESLRKHEEEAGESDSGDSVYSDAAEDPVDLEGDGFGSINAIVDSPMVKPIISGPPKTVKEKDRAPDESPSPVGREKVPADWEATKTFWSDVNESKKAEVKPEAVGIAVTSPSPNSKTQESPINVERPETKAEPKPVKQPETETKPTARPRKKVSQPPANQELPAILETPVPKKSALKKSMRPDSEVSPSRNDVPTLKKTLRGASPSSPSTSPPPARRSMIDRVRDDAGSSQQAVTKRQPLSTAAQRSAAPPPKKAPIKAIPPPMANGSARKTGPVPVTSASAKQAPRPAPKLTRTMSNDSDSSSSFKRERRRKPQQSGGYSMKRSMRESRVQPPAAPAPTRDAPTSRRDRPMSMSGMSLRTSMRETSPLPPRPSSVRMSSPNGSFFGRRKKTEDKPTFSRKFSDSSAENVPTRYASRFRDSSDEEEEILTPVRGIPRRTIEEDSTDLEDSDVEVKPSAPAVASSTMASKSMRPNAAPPTPVVTNLAALDSPDKKRKSFFGVLGRKKDKSKIGKSELDSAARRDTPLERTKLERNAIEYRIATPEPATPLETPLQTPLETPVGSPSSATRPAKLQRRGTSQRTASDSWPLPPPIPQDEPAVVRPTTSDGLAGRPGLGVRQISSMTNTSDGGALGKTGKKKRFGLLRKAFGLND